MSPEEAHMVTGEHARKLQTNSTPSSGSNQGAWSCETGVKPTEEMQLKKSDILYIVCQFMAINHQSNKTCSPVILIICY